MMLRTKLFSRFTVFRIAALFVFAALSFHDAQSQTGDWGADSNSTSGDNEDRVFFVVEQVAEFPGGLDALIKYLGETTVYPKEAKDKGIQGVVKVQFVIETDGTVNLDSITIKESVHPLLDAEAVRVVSLMPKWIPAKQRGKAVRMYFVLPMRFHLKKKMGSK